MPGYYDDYDPDDYYDDSGYGDYIATRAEEGEGHCSEHGFYSMTPSEEKDRWGCPLTYEDPGCPTCARLEEIRDGIQRGDLDPSCLCTACGSEESWSTFMGQRVCRPCYKAIANGETKPDRLHFANPGGRSALRAAGPGNPRVHPCPTCGTPEVLTPQDVARGYQCDTCADKAEGLYRGGDY